MEPRRMDAVQPAASPPGSAPPAAPAPSRGRELSHAFRAALARASLCLSALFPLRALQAPWYRLAPVLWFASKRVRASLRVNLRLCFPEMDAARRRELARASLVQGIAAMLELGPLWRWKKERVLDLVREFDGLELFQEARASGRGVVLLGPHLGSWEVAGLYVSAHAPMTSLYRPPRVEGLEPIYRRARERFGARLVPADAGGVRALYRALKAGEVVGVLPDQDPGEGGGVFAPFFGVAANTSTLTARLVAHTNAVPILSWAERLERGRGFRMHFLSLDPAEIGNRDWERAARALNRALEGLIRTCPEQYLWTYRRFRHRPAGERNPYRHGLETVRAPAADSRA